MKASWGRKTLSLTFLLTGLALGDVACSVIIDPNRQQCSVDSDCTARGAAFAGSTCVDSVCHQQCSVDADCTARGTAFAGSTCVNSVCVADPVWGCLGNVVWPPGSKPRYNVTIQFRDAVTGTPITAVTVSICRKQDFDCTNPIAAGLKPADSGDLAFQVDAGFDGFLSMNMVGALPGLFFFYPPVNDDRVLAGVPLLSKDILDQIGILAGKPYLPEKGVALLAAMDCRNQFAEGVHISSTDADQDTTAFYVIQKIPNSSATFTDSSGQGGLFNLRPGSVAIQGTLKDGRKVGTVTVVVKAGGITYTSMVPAPSP
jgi:hypothetical protein